MVLLVHLEMLGELLDPLREEGDLDFGRPGVRFVEPVLPDQIRFLAIDCQTDR